MTGIVCKARTALALGLHNIARAAGYRVGVRLGLNPVHRMQGKSPTGQFFTPPLLPALTLPTVTDWDKSAKLFSHWPLTLGDGPPDWLANPLTGQRMTAPERPWWEIPDFDPAVGDIKLIWELSRMDWVLALAQRARQGEPGALYRLNDWLADWCTLNPPYQGPNWKCGQEASIRVMHLACAALILGQVREVPTGLRDLITLHLQRIGPTLQYAMAQDNNHGTSEAVALFIGGSWLDLLGDVRGAKWASSGRHWLENRAARLIGTQGSFSQYSLNYHRLMLDTFCIAEVWRRHLGLTEFSARWQSRAHAATEWLRHMVNPVNGDGPNLGANDGARLLHLTDTLYRDYRPSVTLAMALFAQKRAYAPSGKWDHVLQWLGIPVPQKIVPQPQSRIADDGGFAVLRCGNAMAMLRYPRFRFRPSQADALHLDLWLGAENWLRDGGTFSYNTDPKWSNYFAGTASHNTVQFDDRDQMPRLSRFLFGNWLKADGVQPLPGNAQTLVFRAGYKDVFGARHDRQVSLEPGRLMVEDKVQGFAEKAVLRWRLPPGVWRLDSTPQGLRLVLAPDDAVTLSVSSSAPVVRCELVQGWESRHYLEKTPLPVLEVEVRKFGKLITEVLWAK